MQLSRMWVHCRDDCAHMLSLFDCLCADDYRPRQSLHDEAEEDRIRVLGVAELLHVLEAKAEAASQAAHEAETAGPADSVSSSTSA